MAQTFPIRVQDQDGSTRVYGYNYEGEGIPPVGEIRSWASQFGGKALGVDPGAESQRILPDPVQRPALVAPPGGPDGSASPTTTPPPGAPPGSNSGASGGDKSTDAYSNATFSSLLPALGLSTVLPLAAGYLVNHGPKELRAAVNATRGGMALARGAAGVAGGLGGAVAGDAIQRAQGVPGPSLPRRMTWEGVQGGGPDLVTGTASGIARWLMPTDARMATQYINDAEKFGVAPSAPGFLNSTTMKNARRLYPRSVEAAADQTANKLLDQLSQHIGDVNDLGIVRSGSTLQPVQSDMGRIGRNEFVDWYNAKFAGMDPEAATVAKQRFNEMFERQTGYNVETLTKADNLVDMIGPEKINGIDKVVEKVPVLGDVLARGKLQSSLLNACQVTPNGIGEFNPVKWGTDWLNMAPKVKQALYPQYAKQLDRLAVVMKGSYEAGYYAEHGKPGLTLGWPVVAAALTTVGAGGYAGGYLNSDTFGETVAAGLALPFMANRLMSSPQGTKWLVGAIEKAQNWRGPAVELRAGLTRSLFNLSSKLAFHHPVVHIHGSPEADAAAATSSNYEIGNSLPQAGRGPSFLQTPTSTPMPVAVE